VALDRRDLLKLGMLAALGRYDRRLAAADRLPWQDSRADYTITIAPGLVELAPDRVISTRPGAIVIV